MITNFNIFKKIFEKGVTYNKQTQMYDFDFEKDRKKDIMPLQPMQKRSKVLEKDGVKYHYYYGYHYDHNNKTGDHPGFLKAIKYIDSVSEEDASQLTANAVSDICSKYNVNEYSTIVYPKSSSKILTRFVNELAEQCLSEIEIDAAFVKNANKNIQLDEEAVSKLPEANQRQIRNVFNKIKTMSTEFKLKDIYTRYRKFIKNFIKLDHKITKHIKGKKVILMDDYHTTGATLKEMTNILIEMQPKEIFIIILIKVK
jgi:pyrimidine operon attenuation protein/uracil phosphoribosyltransferase